MTMVDTLFDEYYGSREKLAFAFAEILNQEARELAALGADVIQFDEPAFNVYFDEVRDWGVAALERAREGVKTKVAVHICYGYGIEANNSWKKTLGDEWRQYEQTFPLLAASTIDQGLAGMRQLPRPHRAHRTAQGQGRPGGRNRRGQHARGDAGGCRARDPRGVEVRPQRAPLSRHQLRHGAPRAGCGGRQARGIGELVRHLFARNLSDGIPEFPRQTRSGAGCRGNDEGSMNNVMMIALGVGVIVVVGYVLVVRVFFKDSKELDKKIDYSKMKKVQDDEA